MNCNFTRHRGILTSISFLFFWLIAVDGYGQLSVSGSSDANALANTLVGAGVQVLNATLDCPTDGAGTFNGASSNIGLPSGVLLTSGSVNNAPGPNNSAFRGTNGLGGGDADLSALVGGAPICDACVLEFDFIPLADRIRVQYVFASEEYPELVCSPSFIDAFGFFVTGPDPGGGSYSNVNIATIGGSPVSTNSVNGGVVGSCLPCDAANCPPGGLGNTGSFVNNVGGASVQYDGFTVVFTAEIEVTPCETYHLKLAIGDSGDCLYDSGVFLEEGSLTSDFTCPSLPGGTFACESDIPLPLDISSFSVPPSCSDISLSTFDTPSGDNCSAYTVVRTYEIISASLGVLQTCTETFNINAPANPTISCPPAQTVNCETDIAFNVTDATVTVFCGLGFNVTTNGPTLASGNIDCNGAVYEVEYVVEDDCNHTGSCIQTFTINHPNPTWDADPTDLTLECDGTADPGGQIADWLANLGNGTVTAVCGTATITHNFSGLSGGCSPNTGSATVTFTAVDGCGWTETRTATLTIEDTQSPIWNTTPTDLNLDCSAGDPTAAINAWLSSFSGAATDDCSSVTISHDYSGLTPTCGGAGSATVTYTAMDACGNAITAQATVTVTDNSAPTWGPAPTDLTIPCDGSSDPGGQIAAWLASNGGGTATDGCGTVTITNDFSALTDDCAATGSATVTFTATDECGNAVTVQATVQIIDNTPPTFSPAPIDLILNCSAVPDVNVAIANWLASNGGGSATDACGNVTVTNDFSALSGGCTPNTGTATVVFTATDECGNNVTAQARIEITDNTPPTISGAPTDLDLQCDGTSDPGGQIAAWLASNGGITATDDCGNVTITNNFSSLSGGCSPNTGSATVTFTATDDCGNSVTTQAMVTINDTQPPTWNTDPTDLNLNCDGSTDVTTAIANWLASNGGGNATDACSNVTVTNDYTSLSGGCGLSGSATVTFTATDECGLSAVRQANINIVDNTDPQWNTDPTDLTLQCDGTSDPGGAIAAWLANAGAGVVVDGCGTVTVTHDYSGLSDDCGATGSATVTFTATDQCGRTAQRQATVTIEDTTPPTWSVNPTNQTISCDGTDPTAAINAWLASNGGGNATDNCGNVTITNDFSALTPTCGLGGSATVTFTATDECGNAVTAQATLTVQDNTPPTWPTPPNDLNIECDGLNDINALIADWLTNNGNGLPDDACGTVTVTNNFSALSNGCGNTGTATVTFTATDECGNSAVAQANVNVVDNTPPVWDVTPNDLFLECDGSVDINAAINAWLASGGGGAATDGCGNVTITNDFSSLSNDCGNTGNATVTFTATDECGNAITAQAILTVQDNTDPQWNTDPTDLTIDCNGAGNLQTLINNWLNAAGNGVAADACGNVTITNDYTGLSDDCGLTGTATVTFTATDECGRFATRIANIQVTDNTEPEWIVEPLDLVIQCDGTPDPGGAIANWLANFGNSSVSDACGSVTVTHDFAGLNPTCGAGGTATVTFTAEDECGNTSTRQANVEIRDVAPPAWTDAPTDLVLPCDGATDPATAINDWLAAFGNGTAVDACGSVTITNNFTTLSAACGLSGTATVVFTATDECGNTATAQAVIDINDNTPPNWDVDPSDLAIECDGGVDPQTQITDWLAANGGGAASDGCGDVTITNDFNGVRGGCGNSGSATVTFTATDECGNITTRQAEVTIVDNTPPSWNSDPADLLLECGRSSGFNAQIQAWLNSFGGANVTDACGQVTVTNDFADVENSCGSDVVVTFTAEDECGNVSTRQAIVSVQDNTDPEWIVEPQDLFLDCDAGDPAGAIFTWLDGNGLGAVIDACSNVSVTHDFTTLDPTCGNAGEAIVTFTATDECGRSSTASARVLVEDNSAPFWNRDPEDLVLNCDGATNIDIEIANWLENAGFGDLFDGCGAFSLTNDYNGLTSGCGPTGTATVTFTATDDCGNVSTRQADVTVTDNVGPEWTADPEDLVLECDGTSDPGGAIAIWLENAGNGSVRDACGQVTVTNDFNRLPGGCNGTGRITVTFIATDACGNETERQARLFIEDNNGPEIVTKAADKTIECDSLIDPQTEYNNWLAINGGAVARDNCSDITWAHNNPPLAILCGITGSATVTFIATDGCGNASSTSATFKVVDTRAPVLTGVPANVTVDCDRIPAPPIIGSQIRATDGCSTPQITMQETKTNGSCVDNFTLTRVWTATDLCGNTATASQVIAVTGCGPDATVAITPGNNICAGESAGFQVTLNSGYPTPVYQWQFSSDNGVNWNNIAGATAATYNIPAVANADKGQYRVLVSNTAADINNAACRVISNVVTLNILPVKVTDLTESICEGESFTVGTSVYTKSGTFTNTLTAANGCDSIVNLNLTVLPVKQTNLTETICDGDDFVVGSKVYTVSGNYVDTLTGSNGCDSIVNLQLTVAPLYNITLDSTVCFGDSVFVGGKYFKTTGNFSNKLTSVNGCDSIVNLKLTVRPAITTNLRRQICQGQSFTVGTKTFNATGTYREVLAARNGCDSTVVLNLTVVDKIVNDIEATICVGDSYEVGTTSYTETGTYTQTFASAQGCDSTVNLTLTVVEQLRTLIDTAICEGQSITVGSTVYNETGRFDEKLTSSSGCDSLVTLILTVNPVDTIFLKEEICRGESIEVGGTAFTATGNYTINLTSAAGCDSTVFLDLKVLPAATLNVDTTICEGASVSYAGKTFDKTGNYVERLATGVGCDSTITIKLTVLPIKTTNLDKQICQGQTFKVGSTVFDKTGTYREVLTARSGCDSIVNLNLTVLDILQTDLDITICEGESYSVNGKTFNTAGQFTEKLLSSGGCDSVITLDLKILPTQRTNLREVICQGDSIVVGGRPYRNSGIFVDTLGTLSGGCDSIVTLDLTVNPVFTQTLNQTSCEGETFLFGAQNLTATGVFRQDIQTRAGCDSSVVLNLTVLPVKATTLARQICQGKTFNFNGRTLTTNGTYVDTLSAANGCDSVITLTLTVVPQIVENITETICTGQTFAFNGQNLSVAGNYNAKLVSSGGCDSIVNLTLRVLDKLETTLDRSICTGEEVKVGGDTFKTTGTFTVNLISKSGCDSIVTLNLTVLDKLVTSVTEIICEGESVTVGTKTFTTTGVFTETLQSASGCDSIVTLNLTVLPEKTTTLNEVICEGESVQVGSKTFTTTGTFTEILKTSGGCDSTITLNLVVNPAPKVFRQDTIREGEVLTVGGESFTTSGTHIVTLQTGDGCDSIITIDLVILESSNKRFVASICEGESYELAGKVYTQTGVYVDTLISAAGGDSILTLDLKVHPIGRRTLNRQICAGGNVNVGNNTYTEAGTFIDTLSTIHGCDSIVTLNLVVVDVIQETFDVAVCSGEAYDFAGELITAAGTYTKSFKAAVGCDSIVTLNLVVNQVQQQTLDAQICFGERYQVGNKFYTTSGAFVDTLQTAAGCDSIVRLNLQVLDIAETLIQATICRGDFYEVNNKPFFDAGTYVEKLQSANGCDSTVTLELTVNEVPITELNLTSCEDEDVVVGQELLDNPSSGIYRDTLTSFTGCDSIVVMNLTVLPKPQTRVKEFICEGDSLLIDGIYQFQSGEYRQMLTSSITGCDSIVVTELVVEPKVVLIVPDPTICRGESVRLPVSGGEGLPLQWEDHSDLSCLNCDEPEVSPAFTTTYIVSAPSCGNTTAYDTVTVSVNELPEFTLVADEVAVLKGDSVTLQVTDGDPDLIFTWYNASDNTMLCDDCPTFELQPLGDLKIRVIGESSVGCREVQELTVVVNDECEFGEITVANIVTPNGDGHNDFFEMQYEGLSEISLVRVYNRWGELVFESTNVNDKWNGYHKGRPVNPGVFVYYIQGKCLNGRTFTKSGNVTVLR